MKGADTEGVCEHHKRDTSKNRAAGTGDRVVVKTSEKKVIFFRLLRESNP